MNNDNNNDNEVFDENEAAALARLTQDMLCQTNLSPGLIQRLFDFGRVGVQQVHETQRNYDGRENDNGRYLQVTVHRRQEFVMNQLVVVTNSRDQGWSSYPQDQGTRNGSWTWIELGLGSNDNDDNEQNRTRLVTNIHAGQDWERNEAVFAPGNTVLDALSAAVSRNGLDTVSIYTRSCFPGWQCRINLAQVRVLWKPNVTAIAERLQQAQNSQAAH